VRRARGGVGATGGGRTDGGWAGIAARGAARGGHGGADVSAAGAARAARGHALPSAAAPPPRPGPPPTNLPALGPNPRRHLPQTGKVSERGRLLCRQTGRIRPEGLGALPESGQVGVDATLVPGKLGEPRGGGLLGQGEGDGGGGGRGAGRG